MIRRTHRRSRAAWSGSPAPIPRRRARHRCKEQAGERLQEPGAGAERCGDDEEGDGLRSNNGSKSGNLI